MNQHRSNWLELATICAWQQTRTSLLSSKTLLRHMLYSTDLVNESSVFNMVKVGSWGYSPRTKNLFAPHGHYFFDKHMNKGGLSRSHPDHPFQIVRLDGGIRRTEEWWDTRAEDLAAGEAPVQGPISTLTHNPSSADTKPSSEMKAKGKSKLWPSRWRGRSSK